MKLAAICGFAVLALSASGCAAAPAIPDAVLGAEAVTLEPIEQETLIASAGAELDQDTTYVCEGQPRTGSHIPRTVCRTVRQAKQERVEAQDRVRRAAMGAAESTD